jgi:transcriptional regulator with XRE-family HTH domain/cation transport regulator ChaB
MDKAPETLPKAAKTLWVATFNGVLESCKGTTAECDESAAKIAWDQIKEKYRKVKDQWVAKSEYDEAYHDVLLTITKASLQPDGSVRWQAVASDTGKDRSGERTSIELFQDWIDRVTYKADVGYLPKPKMPFLGVSHYPALDGFGEAGTTRLMFIDGNAFKVNGVFNSDRATGQELLNEIKAELALIKKGNQPEKPIRISAGWWDIEHYHEDSNFLFTRQALTDKCPLCKQGQTSDKVYKAGQLDHFAATRVPMNPRTSLELEEKSMATKITRREDAESIIGSDLAEEMERRARMVGKSETEGGDELHPAIVTKADADEAEITKAGDMLPGEFLRNIRRKKKKAHADVEKRAGFKRGRLKRIEDDEDEVDFETMADVAEALDMDDEEMEDMGQRFGKKRKAQHEDEDDDAPPKGSKKEQLLARFGNKRRKMPPTRKAEVEKGYEDTAMEMPMMPPPLLGGATSLKEADDYIQGQKKMDQMYSYWDMLQMAFHNIQRDEEIPDKLKAVSNLFREMSGKIDTLKAGLSDAFLIQESAAAYEDYEDEGAEDNFEDYEDENDEVITMTTEHPADQMKAAIDAALENKSLSGADREAAVQEAFNEYAAGVQAQLVEADPASQADQIATAIKGALTDVLTPFTEQMALMTAKMGGSVATPQPQGVTPIQEVYVPQQKSMMAPIGTPQPVQPAPGMPISPVTGKPSSLTAKIRKSVGIVT